ncbi:MAG: type II toxin-antitoxin system VapC family toxin [Lentisphaerota bacterium]
MESKDVLVDTTIIIDHLRKKNKSSTIFFKLVSDNYDLHISVITLFELLSGAIDEQKGKDIKTTLSFVKILNFDSSSATKASELYLQLKKRNRLVDIRDLFIAASAITQNLPVSTLNLKHFQRIPDLKIFKSF